MPHDTNYINGRNSAIYYICYGEIVNKPKYGTIAYNSWVVGFCDELEAASVDMPECIEL